MSTRHNLHHAADTSRRPTERQTTNPWEATP